MNGCALGALGSLRMGTGGCFPCRRRSCGAPLRRISVRFLFKTNLSAYESRNSLTGALAAPKPLRTASSKSSLGNAIRKFLSYPPLLGSLPTKSRAGCKERAKMTRFCSNRHWDFPCLIASSGTSSEPARTAATSLAGKLWPVALSTALPNSNRPSLSPRTSPPNLASPRRERGAISPSFPASARMGARKAPSCSNARMTFFILYSGRRDVPRLLLKLLELDNVFLRILALDSFFYVS